MKTKEEILDKLLKEYSQLWIVNPERVVFMGMEEYAEQVLLHLYAKCSADHSVVIPVEKVGNFVGQLINTIK